MAELDDEREVRQGLAAGRKSPMQLRTVLLTIALLVWGNTVRADIILNSTDTGWYSSLGFHDSNNPNYIVGATFSAAGDVEYRDFFVFDLAGVLSNGPIVSAQLSLFNPGGGYVSPNPSETYQVTNITTPIPTLESSNTGAVAIFSDLGTNTLYGSQSVSPADDGQQVVIILDSDAIAALNAATGQVAFGGRITDLPPPPNLGVIFAGSGRGDATQLILTTTVPEPPSLPLIGAGLLGLVVLRVQSKKLIAL